jgi:hypothetical protein
MHVDNFRGRNFCPQKNTAGMPTTSRGLGWGEDGVGQGGGGVIKYVYIYIYYPLLGSPSGHWKQIYTSRFWPRKQKFSEWCLPGGQITPTPRRSILHAANSSKGPYNAKSICRGARRFFVIRPIHPFRRLPIEVFSRQTSALPKSSPIGSEMGGVGSSRASVLEDSDAGGIRGKCNHPYPYPP